VRRSRRVQSRLDALPCSSNFTTLPFLVVCERAIVPQRRPVEQSAWRIILTSIAQTTSVVEAGGFLDDVDLAVPQLQKEGFTLKEIATKVAAPIPQSSTGSKP
jgi:hypothetical protein